MGERGGGQFRDEEWREGKRSVKKKKRRRRRSVRGLLGWVQKKVLLGNRKK